MYGLKGLFSVSGRRGKKKTEPARFSQEQRELVHIQMEIKPQELTGGLEEAISRTTFRNFINKRTN